MKERGRAEQPAYQQDEIMREVRAIREAYSKRYNNDVRAILDRCRDLAREQGLKGKPRKPRRIEVRESA